MWPHFTEKSWGAGAQAWLDPSIEVVSSVFSLSALLCSVSASFLHGLLYILPVSHPAESASFPEMYTEVPGLMLLGSDQSYLIMCPACICHCSWDVILIFTPKATWTANGKWLVPQRRVKVLFPEEDGRLWRPESALSMLFPAKSISEPVLLY